MEFICLPCRVHQGVLFVAASLWLHSSGFGEPPIRPMQSEAEVSQRSARGDRATSSMVYSHTAIPIG